MKSKRTFALVAVLAALTIAAPGAQAGTSPDDQPGAHGIGPTAATSVSPDDRRGARGTGPSPVSVTPDDRLGPRGDTVAQGYEPARADTPGQRSQGRVQRRFSPCTGRASKVHA